MRQNPIKKKCSGSTVHKRELLELACTKKSHTHTRTHSAHQGHGASHISSSEVKKDQMEKQERMQRRKAPHAVTAGQQEGCRAHSG